MYIPRQLDRGKIFAQDTPRFEFTKPRPLITGGVRSVMQALSVIFTSARVLFQGETSADVLLFDSNRDRTYDKTA